MDNLISLSDHNSARKKHWDSNRHDIMDRNGIACPKCGTEMVDENALAATDIKGYPTVWIVCPNCGLRRKRIL